jgi:hypothetical protein
MLAELGYPGLLLFIATLSWGILACRRTRALARRHPELQSLAHYATGIEGALVVAVIGGTFFPFQYNEMLWHTVALAMVVKYLTKDRVAALTGVPRTEAAMAPLPLAVARRASG